MRPDPTILWSTTLSGHLPSMKNGRRAVPCKTKEGRRFMRFIRSDEAQGWMETAARELMVVRPKGGPITADVTLYAEIYYRSRRSDLSTETLMDTLQLAGVIKNDRQIRRVIAEAFVDKDNPRVVVALAPHGETAAVRTKVTALPVRPHRDRIGRAA